MSQSHPQTPSTESGAPVAADATPAPKKRNNLMLIVGALGGVAVLGAATLTCGGVAWWRSRPPPALPFPVEKLPATTHELEGTKLDTAVRHAVNVAELDVPEELHWAYLASEMCQSYDTLESVRFAMHSQSENLQKLGDDHAGPLRCGRGWARVVGEGGYAYEITSKEVSGTESIEFIAGRGKPPSKSEYPFREENARLSFDGGRCYRAFSDCGDFNTMVAHRSTMFEKDKEMKIWAYGFRDDFDALVSYSNWKPGRVDELEDQLSFARGADAWEIGKDNIWRGTLDGSTVTIELRAVGESSNPIELMVDTSMGDSGPHVFRPDNDDNDERPEAAAYYAAWKQAFDGVKPGVGKEQTIEITPDQKRTAPYVKIMNARAKDVANQIRAMAGGG